MSGSARRIAPSTRPSPARSPFRQTPDKPRKSAPRRAFPRVDCYDRKFTFIGTGAFTNTAGQLRQSALGGHALISGDVNGDSTADFAILLKGAHTLSGTNFVL